MLIPQMELFLKNVSTVSSVVLNISKGSHPSHGREAALRSSFLERIALAQPQIRRESGDRKHFAVESIDDSSPTGRGFKKLLPFVPILGCPTGEWVCCSSLLRAQKVSPTFQNKRPVLPAQAERLPPRVTSKLPIRPVTHNFAFIKTTFALWGSFLKLSETPSPCIWWLCLGCLALPICALLTAASPAPNCCLLQDGFKLPAVSWGPIVRNRRQLADGLSPWEMWTGASKTDTDSQTSIWSIIVLLLNDSLL